MKTLKNILIYLVDDDKLFLKSLEHSLQHMLNYNIKIKSFLTGEECIKNLSKKPDIIILDQILNSNHSFAMDGLQVLQTVKQKDPDATVIMVSGKEKMKTVLETIRSGAYDYIIKSKNSPFEIKSSIINAMNSISTSKQLNNTILITKLFIIGIALVMVVLLLKQSFFY